MVGSISSTSRKFGIKFPFWLRSALNHPDELFWCEEHCVGTSRASGDMPVAVVFSKQQAAEE
jgi:hypothetical protein